jgi:uncharacterized membrane protein YsdA (DUF1294 family)
MTSVQMLLILVTLFVLNLAVMLLYRHDKVRARKGGRRVPESTLLWAALVAPFGAVYGMRAFHHKTRHRKFLLVYTFMAFQIALITYLLLML